MNSKRGNKTILIPQKWFAVKTVSTYTPLCANSVPKGLGGLHLNCLSCLWIVRLQFDFEDCDCLSIIHRILGQRLISRPPHPAQQLE